MGNSVVYVFSESLYNGRRGGGATVLVVGEVVGMLLRIVSDRSRKGGGVLQISPRNMTSS